MKWLWEKILSVRDMSYAAPSKTMSVLTCCVFVLLLDFDDMGQIALFHAISSEDYYPLAEDVSPEAKSLIDGLLRKDPMYRLGSLAGRGKDILKMSWFDSLNLRDLRKKRFQAPFIPAKGILETIEDEETDGLL